MWCIFLIPDTFLEISAIIFFLCESFFSLFRSLNFFLNIISFFTSHTLSKKVYQGQIVRKLTTQTSFTQKQIKPKSASTLNSDLHLKNNESRSHIFFMSLFPQKIFFIFALKRISLERVLCDSTGWILNNIIQLSTTTFMIS